MSESTLTQGCIFCEIVNHRAPAEIIYQDEQITAFWDINRQVPVHILVVPNLHYDSLDAVPSGLENLLGHMILVAKNIAKHFHIQEAYRIFINTGASAGQTIFHLHLHLVGGRKLGRPYE
ncbi:MAG TPA: HIT domain-containing protein [Anaerolineaceae bacterium]